MNLSRLTDWRPDPAALKGAARAAIIIPICFGLVTHFIDSDDAPVFAAFGSFAVLVFVDFGGRTRQRLVAYLGLGLVGVVLITLGTLCSSHMLLSTAVTAAVTFVIFFSGVINGYLAAARTAAVLLLVLPVMIPGTPADIGDRLIGWGVACGISIPAVFLLWKLPWNAELRKGCSAACLAMARLIEKPDDADLRDEANDSIAAVRQRFLASPHRPNGPTGPTAAIAGLIEQLGWTVSQFFRDGPSMGDPGGPDVIRTRKECAATMRRTSDVILGGEGSVSTTKIDEARQELIQNFSERAGGKDHADELLKVDLARTFRLRLLSFSVADAAGFANVATGEKPAPGALGQRWLSILGKQRRQAVATEHLIADHISLRSAWFRNSVRGGIGIALAVLVAELVNADNAFWVVLGTLSVLRSNAIGTEASVMSALRGTIVGIVIGAAVIALIGEHQYLLWIALPLTVLGAAYASAAISFAAGQAAFSVMVMVLFNLIAPIGVEVGLVRIIDVGIGCAVSLAVGLLLWPRGARELVRRSLGDAYESASRLVSNRVRAAIKGETSERLDPVRNDAVASIDRLDAALRQRLEESSAAHVDAESLVALTACVSRLLRTSHAFRMMVLMPWYEPVPAAMADQIVELDERVAAWYTDCAQAFRGSGQIPRPDSKPADYADSALDLIGGASNEKELHAALSGAWVLQGLEYLLDLEKRVADHADQIFTASEARKTGPQLG
ncbi:MAG: FUSC family protein [Solirubrobacterales bacterium]